MFHEIKPKKKGQRWDKVGDLMVAKESRFIEDEESKEAFHLHFCCVQHMAQTFATEFNDAVMKAPLLKPSDDKVSLPPPITFLDCSVYEYTNEYNERCGLLVEKYLRGKFTKFNSNNGFIHEDHDGASIQLAIGEVLLTDFVQAFSHWVYKRSCHNMLVCDLQGILDMEGFQPAFRLTDPATCSKLRGRISHYGNQGRLLAQVRKSDLGMRGIRNFCCHRHICNNVCAALKLPPPNGRYLNKKKETEDGWTRVSRRSTGLVSETDCQLISRIPDNDCNDRSNDTMEEVQRLQVVGQLCLTCNDGIFHHPPVSYHPQPNNGMRQQPQEPYQNPTQQHLPAPHNAHSEFFTMNVRVTNGVGPGDTMLVDGKPFVVPTGTPSGASFGFRIPTGRQVSGHRNPVVGQPDMKYNYQTTQPQHKMQYHPSQNAHPSPHQKYPQSPVELKQKEPHQQVRQPLAEANPNSWASKVKASMYKSN